MDPNATLRELLVGLAAAATHTGGTEAQAEIRAEVAERCHALGGWLERDGFLPSIQQQRDGVHPSVMRFTIPSGRDA
jgi:hypothetical protein